MSQYSFSLIVVLLTCKIATCGVQICALQKKVMKNGKLYPNIGNFYENNIQILRQNVQILLKNKKKNVANLANISGIFLEGQLRDVGHSAT